jgi:ferredoxin-type protein NapF
LSLQAGSNTFSDAAPPRGCLRIRRLVRGAILVVAVLSLWPILPGRSTLALVPALSPFVVIGTILVNHTFHALAWLGIVVGLAAIVRRRLFCRWVCPVGVCMDGAGWLGRRFGRRIARFPLLGPWIVLLTLGGACLGYPLFLWLDPLARFAGLFDLGGQGPTLGAALPVAGFLAMLVFGFLWPNSWCGCVCPLGALQDLLSSLPMRSRKKSSRSEAPDAGVPVPRRMLLGAAAGAAWAGVMRVLGRAVLSSLRPPGAVDEPAFSGTCTRCGNCARVCPSGIIERDLGSGGWAGLLTPVLRFRKDYCREDCVRCTEVCPSGALMRVAATKKADVRLGLPRVDMSLCLLGEDRECSLCRSRCPYGAIRYVFSEADYTLTPQIDSNKCNGCGACEAACPTAPRKAIVVVPT